MLLLDARHGFKKLDMEFLALLYDPKGLSPLGERLGDGIMLRRYHSSTIGASVRQKGCVFQTQPFCSCVKSQQYGAHSRKHGVVLYIDLLRVMNTLFCTFVLLPYNTHVILSRSPFNCAPFANNNNKYTHTHTQPNLFYAQAHSGCHRSIQILLTKCDLCFCRHCRLHKNNKIFPRVGKYRPPKIQILMTKCDLVKRIDLARRVALVRQQMDEVR